ncbi:Acetylcholinesterase [Melipona quadrifasciata]|uniref:Acetylcholinesterase n=1 Tax=Melipona quadrifasciata TaxID=166423 RepID=A0A0M8ZRE5_9HYME|nr:Acetylcholinesterase [Melipona quadrifasciata]
MSRENTVIRVKQGQLRGTVEKNRYGDEYLAFRGIPYAKPPLGPLRFKDPEPAEPWLDVRDASGYSDVCFQKSMITRDWRGSEDCLYLNVYKPITRRASRMSVMVWIHGGAFVEGSGDDEIYGPEYLMRKDVVLVAINYRLGVLGFLNLEHKVAAGNQGLKDQVMALKWVQSTGIPTTSLYSEKALAVPRSITKLYLRCLKTFVLRNNVNVQCIEKDVEKNPNHLVEGDLQITKNNLRELRLFHKAIAQSGVVVNFWASITKEPSKYAFLLAAKLGESSTDPETVVEFLRTIDVQKLVTTALTLLTPQRDISIISDNPISVVLIGIWFVTELLI